MQAGFQSLTPNWPNLAKLRQRGQRPLGLIYVTDQSRLRTVIGQDSGIWALPLPQPTECYLLAGLWAVMFAKRTEHTQEVALQIASANPKRFVVGWQGERWDHVI